MPEGLRGTRVVRIPSPDSKYINGNVAPVYLSRSKRRFCFSSANMVSETSHGAHEASQQQAAESLRFVRQGAPSPEPAPQARLHRGESSTVGNYVDGRNLHNVRLPPLWTALSAEQYPPHSPPFTPDLLNLEPGFQRPAGNPPPSRPNGGSIHHVRSHAEFMRSLYERSVPRYLGELHHNEPSGQIHNGFHVPTAPPPSPMYAGANNNPVEFGGRATPPVPPPSSPPSFPYQYCPHATATQERATPPRHPPPSSPPIPAGGYRYEHYHSDDHHFDHPLRTRSSSSGNSPNYHLASGAAYHHGRHSLPDSSVENDEGDEEEQNYEGGEIKEEEEDEEEGDYEWEIVPIPQAAEAEQYDALAPDDEGEYDLPEYVVLASEPMDEDEEEDDEE
ncbi:hypothetical protein BZA77DRAFT_315102 [Pyronema omphalodes]|nr:hypothetical protein BZA77DRAFT_315102 [Pyronema omphalodes]